MSNVPAHEGFFWGRWHTPAPGTADGGNCCGGMEWEVHHVVQNDYRADEDEPLLVMVPGVEEWQPLDAFEWGAEVVR